MTSLAVPGPVSAVTLGAAAKMSARSNGYLRAIEIPLRGGCSVGRRRGIAESDAEAHGESVLRVRGGQSVVGAHDARESAVRSRGVPIGGVGLDDLAEEIVGPQDEEIVVLAGAVLLLVEG